MTHYLTHEGMAKFYACGRVATLGQYKGTKNKKAVTCEECLAVLKTWKAPEGSEEAQKQCPTSKGKIKYTKE